MRTFTQKFSGFVVDLDDPSTYDYIGSDDVNVLNDIMLSRIGYSICYMDYWNKNIFATEPKVPEMMEYKGRMVDINIENVGYQQRIRVNSLIEDFTKNRSKNWENPLWFKEQIFIFDDETENMC